MQQGTQEAGSGGLGLREARFQLVAERHQGIDPHHDAVLFGEGWEGDWHTSKIANIYAL